MPRPRGRPFPRTPGCAPTAAGRAVRAGPVRPPLRRRIPAGRPIAQTQYEHMFETIASPGAPGVRETCWPRPDNLFRCDAHPPRRHPPCRARRTDRHPRRVGGPPPRSRGGDLHRPAGRVRRGPGGLPRGRDGRAGAPAARRVLRPGHRRGRAPPGGQREPRPPHRRDRGHRHRARRARRVRAAAVPARRAPASVGEEIRLKHRYLDLRRPGPAAALRLRSEANRIARDRAARARLRRGRDARR